MSDLGRARDVQAAVAGDGDALQRLIVHYHGPLHAAVQAALPPDLRPRVDPEDVLQHAYVVAFQTVTTCSFDGPAAFYAWLERVALSRLKDLARAARRAKRDVGREVPGGAHWSATCASLVEQITGHQPTPSYRLAREEAVAALLSCLARLSEDQREVVRLRFLEGLPVAEVAARLSKTEAAVHMLCHRGLKALRVLLESLTRYLTGR